MTLRVEPSALDGFAGQVDRAADNTVEIKTYFDQYADAGTGGEIYNIAASAHEDVRVAVARVLDRVAALLGESAPAVSDAAMYYRGTEFANAAELDQYLPWEDACTTTRIEHEVIANPCQYNNFADSRDVLGRLTQPMPAGNPANPLGWMDMLSISHWANETCKVVLGVDPIGSTQQKLTGDWQAMAAMAPVSSNVSAALHAAAYNMQTGAGHLHDVWDGNAGDSAYQFFTRANNAIAELAVPFAQISAEYQGLADAVWSIGEAIGTFIKAMLDAALIAGISAAAGTITAETGVGAVIGYGVAAVEVARMLDMWSKATSLVWKLTMVALAFRSALAEHLATIDVVKLPDLGGPYRHPAL